MQHLATNFNNAWEYADDLDDFVLEDNIQGVGLYLNSHDHTENLGLPAGRVTFGAAAARPVAGHQGHVYVATDTGVFSYDDGAAWHAAMVLDVVQAVTACLKFEAGQDWKQIATPANPSAGYSRLYVKSDGFAYILDSSGNEDRLAGPAAGTCLPYFGTVLPAGGYLWADGASQLVATYSVLSGVIRPTLGGADASHFYTPDYRGRFPMGADNFGQGAAARASGSVALGNSGVGADTVALATGTVPTASYNVGGLTVTENALDAAAGGANILTNGAVGGAGIPLQTGAGGFSNVHDSGSPNVSGGTFIVGGVITDNNGGGAHNNRPLDLVCNWVVKT